LEDVNISRLPRRRFSLPLGRTQFLERGFVQLTDAISADLKTVALPAAALLFVLVLLITAFTGGVPG
jgi:hypothetical protein